MKKQRKLRITIMTLVLCAVCIGVPGSLWVWASDAGEPTIGKASNAADSAAVFRAGVNVTDAYKEKGRIELEPEIRGTFGELIFGDTNSYTYSADVTFNTDSSSYGSIRLVVGEGTNASGVKKTVEVCVRPNLNDAVLFATGSGEDALGHVNAGKQLEIGKTYRYTVRYEAGKVSFWLDGNRLFADVNVAESLSNIMLSSGFYSQNCTGYLSNVQIWGDVTSVIDTTAENAAAAMRVMNNGTDVTASYKGTGTIQVSEDGRGTIDNLIYGNTNRYAVSADVVYRADSSTYGSIRLIIGKGLDASGTEKTVEVCIRPNLDQVLVGTTLSGGDENWPSVGTISGLEFDKVYRHTILYDNGRISFWVNGALMASRLDMRSTLRDLVPTLGFYSQHCTGSISNIVICGDVSGIVAPEFDASKDTNLMKEVIVENPITGKLSALTDCAVSTGDGYTSTSRMTLYGVEYGKSYNFSTNASFADNKSMNGDSEVNWEGLIFRVATVEKDGEIYDMEVRVRNGLVTIFVGEMPYGQNWDVKTAYDTVNSYTVEYRNDNTISFYKNGQAIYYRYDVTKEGYTNVKPKVGFGGEVCSYSYTGMKLWGDVKFNEKLVPEMPVEPIFDADADINLMEKAVVTNPSNGRIGVLDSCSLITDRSYTTSAKAEVSGLAYGESYNFSTKAAFYDNKNMNGDNEIDWEGLVFRVATVEKGGKTYNVEVRFRKNLVGVFVGETPYALNFNRGTAYDSENQYTVSYHADGTFSVFQNGIAIYWKYDITKEGYANIEPSFAFGGEVCAFGYRDMKLWGDISLKELPGVPKKPASNANYGDYMRVPNGSIFKYEDGKVYSTTDEIAGRREFQYLPFNVDDTYVFGFNINTKKAEKQWMGPRILFGNTSDGKELALFIMENSIAVYAGSEEVKAVSLGRELNQVYRVDLLIEPEAVSVWIDNVLLIDKCKLPKKSEVKTGILFENAIAVMSHIDLYYTEEVEFVAPEIPEPPVLKTLADGQYNAADWMKVTLNGNNYGGYFENKLSSTDSSVGNRYLFENLSVTDDMPYYYSATYTVTESSEVWKGPRFIFRHDNSNAFCVAILQDRVSVLAGGKEIASETLKLQLGKSYDIVMYSTPTEISVWIDRMLIFESVDLTPYIGTKLSAKPGLLFELCQAKVNNIAIYGDKLVFDEKYVDPELYFSKYYRMKGIPAMTGLNLFQNIGMTDFSNGAIGAKFDAAQNILTTEYNNGSGLVTLTDANGSYNLNGLKNESGYVFSFKYRVDDWEAENAGYSGFWITTNESAGPWTTKSNTVRVGLSGNDLMLKAYREDTVIADQLVPLKRVDGKTYDVAIVHGKNWIKLYIDNELRLVSTDLPTYNVAFKIDYSNMQSEISDMKVYEFEDSGLQILETKESQERFGAGNTIYDATDVTFYSRIKVPVTIIAVASGVILLSLAGIIILMIREAKKRKTKAGMGGEASCERE